MGTGGAVVHRRRRRRIPVRSSGPDQDHSRIAGAVAGHRAHGAGPLAGQLLRRDRAGGFLPGQRATGHRLQQRPAAAGAPVLLPGHPAAAPGRPELPPDPGECAQVPVCQSSARRPHADAGSQGSGGLRSQFAAGGHPARDACRIPQPCQRRRWPQGSHPRGEFRRPLQPGPHVLPQPRKAGAGALGIGAGVRVVQGGNAEGAGTHRQSPAQHR